MANVPRQLIWNRAGGCCEYCQIPQEYDVQSFQVDHIRAQKHRGATNPDNLALSCLACNSHKGPNAAGYDPETDSLEPLFNPREQNWTDHFVWEGPFLTGITPIGRTTVEVLGINLPERVEHRRILLDLGLFPGSR